jgi:hypothetical protein
MSLIIIEYNYLFSIAYRRMYSKLQLGILYLTPVVVVVLLLLGGRSLYTKALCGGCGGSRLLYTEAL